MSPILRNVLAVVAGFFLGSVVNMGIIMGGSTVIPLPAGVDVTSTESLKASMHLFRPVHFVTPFLAHALGTLVGAMVTARLAATRKSRLAMVIGVAFLCGGVAGVFMLPAPAWFVALDLVGAYLPMGWLGGRLAAGPGAAAVESR